ncbi:MAG: oxygenase MpaB family protein [Polyangiales bacterium]
MRPHYQKTLGLLRDPRVRTEIAGLDPVRDCQRIVHLLVAYEFPWDITRALELALFYTYGSDSVARLLDRTGEFERRGQKRYDDTQILIGEFLESGWEGPRGRRALARMNALHGRFSIPNDDFLFVLWSFIDYPIRWAAEFAHRPFSAGEQTAWFTFWCEIGARMGLRDVPGTRADFARFIEGYERVHLVYSEPSRRVADATVRIMEGWLPRPLRFAVQPVARSLVSERLREALGYAPAPGWVRTGVRGALKLRGHLSRHLALGSYPSLMATLRTRTYVEPVDAIEEIGPSRASETGKGGCAGRKP